MLSYKPLKFLSTALTTMLFCATLSWASAVSAEAGMTSGGDDVYKPTVGQEGKDVIWVPTDDALVRAMLQTAKVTPNDLVYDLGAGDGKIAIAAARDYGATAVGIEYNPEMAALAQRNAERAGVADKVKVIHGDIFEEDFSNATVVTLYLLPQLNMQLRPTLLDMKPGTRIVSNSFDMEDWQPDEYINVELSSGYFWIVPAKVQGSWSLTGLPGNEPISLDLNQRFQIVEGVVKSNGVEQALIEPKLSGENFSFEFVDTKGLQQKVELKVAGDQMAGQASSPQSSVAVSASRLN
jgi:SAM-dependent methyltransferase